MGLSMFCPWCEKTGKSHPIFTDWKDVKAHLKRHGATNEQIEQAEKAWITEMYAVNHPYEVYAGCSEWEALGVSPDDAEEYYDP